MTLKNDLQASIYRDSFHDFYIAAFKNVLDPSVDYIDNWHTKYICDVMQAEALRIIRKEPREEDIIINVPVRSGKSLIASVAFNAWVWTICPSFKVITASYSASLSISLSRKTRELVKSNWYRQYFDIQFKDDQDTKGYFENTHGGFRKMTSTNGSITGEGGDIIIPDDLVNPAEADSEKERKNANEWYDGTLYTRLNTPDIGSRVIIMQRLAEKDLTGHLLEKGGYRHICIPAELSINVKPKELSSFYEDGLFFIKRFTKKVLDNFRKALGDRHYEAQFGQSPKIPSGNIIKTSKFKYLEEPPRINQVIQIMDTAFKTDEKNDYSVCITMGSFRHPDNLAVDSYYIMSVLRGKFEFPELKLKMEAIAKRYKPYRILIEDKASGQSLIQSFKEDKYLKPLLMPVSPDTDKVTRAYSITGTVEDGLVYLPKLAQWKDEFVNELTLFDSGEHDDQVDTFVYGLQYFTKKLGDHAEPRLRIL